MMQIAERLVRELDAWTGEGLTAKFWWRDDDAVSDTPQLRRLLDIARGTGMLLALGVVPERADDSLVSLVAGAPCCVWQHGWGHHFHTAGEFGEGRPLDRMTHDAMCGQRALDRLFGPAGWQRVFVPPNHLISMPFKTALPRLGYLGLSAGGELTPHLAGVVEQNAEIDVMNWPEGTLLDAETVFGMVADQLKARRLGEVPVGRPVGILTHHLVFNDEALDFVSRLFLLLSSHAAVELMPADALFGRIPHAPESRPTSAQPNLDRATADITVVVTSCGRQDLLIRTLDSFLKYNTYPIREFVVMEDGDARTNVALEERYQAHNFKWLATGRRIGQIAAVDMAYCAIQTEYIFHCEDDWEFYAPGFIEKSLCVLNHNAEILQVWIRAISDTNNCPVMDYLFFAGDVAYRLIQPGYHSQEWGVWHGFSFNPGLRRRRDYQLIESFGALDPLHEKQSYEVEREVSALYLKHGFFSAILADDDGRGYVRHIGWGRRVGEPT
jgi:hypothetical protein